MAEKMRLCYDLIHFPICIHFATNYTKIDPFEISCRVFQLLDVFGRKMCVEIIIIFPYFHANKSLFSTLSRL